MIPIPKPKLTIGFALVLIAGGALGFINAEDFGLMSDLPLPVLGVFLWAVAIYLIAGSVHELKRRSRRG